MLEVVAELKIIIVANFCTIIARPLNTRARPADVSWRIALKYTEALSQGVTQGQSAGRLYGQGSFN